MDIGFWFCCLATPELTVTRLLCAAFTVSLGGPIPAAAFDALWLPFDRRPLVAQEAYRSCYSLGRAWVIDPVTEEPEEVVFILNLAWWVELIAYAASPAGSCSGGCGWPDYS